MRRRDFIAGLAAVALPRARSAAAALPVTGETNPKLALYDTLMADFMARYNPPGASLAISKDGRLIYARAFGFADRERREPVQPKSLFRIASLTKAFTSTAVFQLVEQKKLRLDDKVFEIIKLQPFLERGADLDPRIHTITVLNCLQHTGGWDRGKGFDPMGWDGAEQIARAMSVRLPVTPEQIIRYTLGRRLDFNPGAAYVYSNFGYCVVGRVIEAVSGEPYAGYVERHVLSPLGIARMRLGRNLLRDRAPDEVKYYDAKHETARAISGPDIGRQAPMPYGVECIESMDANGGWIASAATLVRFLDAFNDIRHSKLLDETNIRAMLSRPPGPLGLNNGKPASSYYACGWEVRVFSEQQGHFNKWHSGGLRGSDTFMFARQDRINWAILFNSDSGRDGKNFTGIIVPLLNNIATAQIKDWPEDDLYSKVAL
jgi:CubicO group peptidase (beta-lactamase class C family)